MFNDHIHNLHEEAHRRALQKGFDLGWTYKGEFDRSIIRDEIQKAQNKKDKKSELILKSLLYKIKNHKCNRENIFK